MTMALSQARNLLRRNNLSGDLTDDCVTSFMSFFYYSFLFIEGWGTTTVHWCDKHLTIENILLTCSDFIEIRESHFTAKSLHMLFQDISPEKIFNFLKEINIFGKI